MQQLHTRPRPPASASHERKKGRKTGKEARPRRRVEPSIPSTPSPPVLAHRRATRAHASATRSTLPLFLGVRRQISREGAEQSPPRTLCANASRDCHFPFALSLSLQLSASPLPPLRPPCVAPLSMKFGKTLQTSALRDWKRFYINYNRKRRRERERERKRKNSHQRKNKSAAAAFSSSSGALSAAVAAVSPLRLPCASPALPLRFPLWSVRKRRRRKRGRPESTKCVIAQGPAQQPF